MSPWNVNKNRFLILFETHTLSYFRFGLFSVFWQILCRDLETKDGMLMSRNYLTFYLDFWQIPWPAQSNYFRKMLFYQILYYKFIIRFRVLTVRHQTTAAQAQSWGQFYKDFYTSGQIYKCVLKHENNALAQTFVSPNVRTQHTNIFPRLHFSLSFKLQFRLFILHRPKV